LADYVQGHGLHSATSSTILACCRAQGPFMNWG
jgi:hypothetical protein